MSEIVFNSPTPAGDLQTQIESLQTTLASLNQQVIILQEALQEKDQEIADLKMRLSESVGSTAVERPLRVDDTLTIIGALIKLYKFVFPPGKVE